MNSRAATALRIVSRLAFVAAVTLAVIVTTSRAGIGAGSGPTVVADDGGATAPNAGIHQQEPRPAPQPGSWLYGVTHGGIMGTPPAPVGVISGSHPNGYGAGGGGGFGGGW